MPVNFSDQRLAKCQSLCYSNKYVYFPHIIRCFYLHYCMFYLTNVSVNTPLIHFYGFCRVIVEEKVCSVIYRLDIFRTCTDHPNWMDLRDVKCYASLFCSLACQ